ncbi:hypothetical protein C8F01DRAFT_1236481 [Mycena amicta]|nr:hypothetical protein C8F01DRAFT_1236481 [Mycena amicta]
MEEEDQDLGSFTISSRPVRRYGSSNLSWDSLPSLLTISSSSEFPELSDFSKSPTTSDDKWGLFGCYHRLPVLDSGAPRSFFFTRASTPTSSLHGASLPSSPNVASVLVPVTIPITVPASVPVRFIEEYSLNELLFAGLLDINYPGAFYGKFSAGVLRNPHPTEDQLRVQQEVFTSTMVQRLDQAFRPSVQRWLRPTGF